MFVARNSTGHILRNRTRKSAAAVCCVGRSGHCVRGVSTTKTERDCSPVSQGTTGAGPRALTTQGTFAPWLVGCVAGACGFRCHMNRLVGSLPVFACRIRTLLCRGSSSCPTSSPPLLRDYRGLVKSKRRPDPLGSCPLVRSCASSKSAPAGPKHLELGTRWPAGRSGRPGPHFHFSSTWKKNEKKERGARKGLRGLR